MVTAPKANISEIERRNMQVASLKEEKALKEKLKNIEKTEQEAKEQKRRELDALTQKSIDQSKDFNIREAKKEDVNPNKKV